MNKFYPILFALMAGLLLHERHVRIEAERSCEQATSDFLEAWKHCVNHSKIEPAICGKLDGTRGQALPDPKNPGRWSCQ